MKFDYAMFFVWSALTGASVAFWYGIFCIIGR